MIDQVTSTAEVADLTVKASVNTTSVESSFLGSTWSVVSDGAAWGWESVTGVFSSGCSAVTGVFSGIYDTGASVVGGVYDGVASGLSATQATILSAGEAGLSAINTGFQTSVETAQAVKNYMSESAIGALTDNLPAATTAVAAGYWTAKMVEHLRNPELTKTQKAVAMIKSSALPAAVIASNCYMSAYSLKDLALCFTGAGMLSAAYKAATARPKVLVAVVSEGQLEQMARHQTGHRRSLSA